MAPPVLKDISRHIQRINASPLADRIGKYIRISAAVDESLRNPELNGLRAARQLDICRRELTDDISTLLARLSDARARIVDLRYTKNDHDESAPEASEPARKCFVVLKRHGMELLAHLTDEVSIVGETLRLGEQVRGMVSDHTAPMKRAAHLLDILLERFAHRPTVAYRVAGESADVRQLTYAVEGMERWDSGADSAEGDGSAESLRVATLSPYGRIARSMWEALEQHRRKIKAAAAELKEGWNLLYRLSVKGDSPKIRQKVEKLSFQHEARCRAFQKSIRESRAAAPLRRRAG